MSDTIKDSVVSTVTIENFVEEIASAHDTNYIVARPFPVIVAGQRWDIGLCKATADDDGEDYLDVMFLFAPNGLSFCPEEILTTYSISLIKNNNERYRGSGTSESGSVIWRKFIKWAHLVDGNSPFLTNGALTLQMEIRADAITDRNGIRKFNFHDPFEGCVKFKMINGQKMFYARKEMVMYHSPMLARHIAAGADQFFFFSNGNDDFEYEFDMFLQLIHGVSIEIVPMDCFDAIFGYAVEYGTNDIIRRCETHLSINFVRGWVRGPMVSKINHVKRKLKTKKSLEEVRKMAKCYIEYPLDSEMLKAIVREFFSYADDSNRVKSVDWWGLETMKRVASLCLETMKRVVRKFFSFVPDFMDRNRMVSS